MGTGTEHSELLQKARTHAPKLKHLYQAHKKELLDGGAKVLQLLSGAYWRRK